MKNVAPNARSFERDSPFTIAAIACSRIPKCRFFPPGATRLNPPRAIIFQCGLVRRSKIRRTTEEPGDILRKNVQHFSGCLAPGDSLWIGEEDGKVAIPPIRKFAPLHEINFGRELGI